MKKTKKLFAGIALAAMLLTTGCNTNSSSNQPGAFRQQDVYQLYRAAGGGMSYEEWLNSIKGADGSQFYADAVDPQASAGKDGDVFVNIASWDFFLKIGGNWQRLGNLKGEQGIQGPKGDKGDQGEQGPKGDAGSQIFADAGIPNASAGREGDMYFNLETWDVYMKLNGNWQNLGNIKGATGQDGQNGFDGANGSQIYADAVDPQANGGFDGDVFFNIVSWDVFMKINGNWQKIGNIKGNDGKDGVDGKDGQDGKDGVDGKDGQDGQDGQDGASILRGYGRPSDNLGSDGDSFIDLNNFDFYVKENGHWAKVNNIRENLRWDLEVEADMYKYLGEPLPYLDLNEETMYYGFDTSYEMWYGFDVFIIGDDNPYNLVEDYGERLIAAGFEYNPAAAEFGGEYIKTTPRGYQIEVTFDYFEATSSYAAGNEIDIYMPPYVDPYSDEYFLELGYELINGWPKENVDFVMGDDVIPGVNLEGDWYEMFDKYDAGDDGIYYYDLLATEGEYADALIAQAEAAGFTYYPDYNCWLDANEDAEIDIDERDGWTHVKFFGPYIMEDYDESYFIENGFTKQVGWPEDLIALSFNEENVFDGVNVDGDWFVKATTNTYTSGSHAGQMRTSGYLATQGDFADDFAQNLLDAGFIWEDYWEDYELPNDSMTYLMVNYTRGYTIIQFYGSYVEDPNYTPATTVAYPEVANAIEAYFGNNDITLNVPDYYAIEGCTVTVTGDTIKVNGSSNNEKDAFVASLVSAGWTKNPGNYSGDWTMTYGDTGAALDVEDWYSYIKIVCKVVEPPVQYTPAETSAIILDYFDELGLDADSIVLPDYDFEDVYFNINDAYVSSLGVLLADAYNTARAQMDSFAVDLAMAGWDVTDGDSEGDYVAKWDCGDAYAVIEVQDYLDGDYVRLVIYGDTKPLDAAATTAAILDYFELDCGLSGIDLPDYETTNGYFSVDDSYVLSQNLFVAYAYDTNEAEMDNFLADLALAGWELDPFSTTTLVGTAASFDCGDALAVIEVQDFLDNDVVRLVCYVGAKPIDAAGATAAMLEFWEDYFDLTDIDLPDYVSEEAVFETDDSYIATEGFFVVTVDGTTAAELDAWLGDLVLAGWDLEPYTASSSSGYVATFGDEGDVPVMEIQDHSANGYFFILCYTDYKMGDTITAEQMIQYIANQVGGTYDDLGDGMYALEAGYLASSVSIDTIKGWIANYFVPASFELIDDWYATEIFDLDAECCVYYDEVNDVVLEFYTFSWTSGTTPVNSFYVVAYPGNNA